MVPLRVVFVIPAQSSAQGEALQAERLLRAWQADTDVEVSAVHGSGMLPVSWPPSLTSFSRADVIHVFPAPSSCAHGLLAPLADFETLGHHVLRLLASPDYARGLARAGHATCDAWTWPRVREQWLRTYAGALVPPARAPRSALTRFIAGSVPFAGTDLQIGAERTDSPAAQRRAS